MGTELGEGSKVKDKHREVSVRLILGSVDQWGWGSAGSVGSVGSVGRVGWWSWDGGLWSHEGYRWE